MIGGRKPLGLAAVLLVAALPCTAAADGPLDPVAEFVVAQRAALEPLGPDGLPPGAHNPALFERVNALVLGTVKPGQDARTVLPLGPHSAATVWAIP